MTFIDAWHWPQWAMAILMTLGLLVVSAQHGHQRLQTSGPEKGEPERYNAFIAIIRFMLWAFILSAGGFFS